MNMATDWFYVIYIMGSGLFFFIINIGIWLLAAMLIGAVIGVIFLVLRLIFWVTVMPILFIIRILFSPPVFWGIVVILWGWYYIHQHHIF